MAKKDTLAGIVQDSKRLLTFHQSLGIDSYPLTDGIKTLLKKSPAVKTKSRPQPRQTPPPSPSPHNKITQAPKTITTPPESLGDIQQQLGDCTRCALHKNRGSILFGKGPNRAKLMIIGEWPNVEDDRSGALFNGPDGEMLDNMLKHVLKIERENAYIASIIKCLAGKGKPSREEINTCLPFLLAQIRSIHPTVIWTMGPVPAQTLLQTNKPLIRLRGHFYDFKGIPLMPTFHPAYLAKNPEMKQAVFQDLKMIAEKLAD